MSKHELEQNLMRRLVDGIVGWATYYQACGAGRHYDEHLFYQHIEAIAVGRGWKVKQQQKIVSTKGPGAPSTVDFVIYRPPGNLSSRAGIALVEVKYLRGDSPSQDASYLWQDVEKLRGLKVGELADSKTLAPCGLPAKFLLVVGQNSGLAATTKINPRLDGSRKAVEMLREATADVPPDSIYWAEANTYLKESLRWRAMAIASRRWPK